MANYWSNVFLFEQEGKGQNRNVRLGGNKTTSDRVTLISEARKAREARRRVRIEQNASIKILNFWRTQKSLKELADVIRSRRNAIIERAYASVADLSKTCIASLDCPGVIKAASNLLCAFLSVIILYNPLKDGDDLLRLFGLIRIKICTPSVGEIFLVHVSMLQNTVLWGISYPKLLKAIFELTLHPQTDTSGILSPENISLVCSHFLSLELQDKIFDIEVRKDLKNTLNGLFIDFRKQCPSLYLDLVNTIAVDSTKYMDLYICLTSMILSTTTGPDLVSHCAAISVMLFTDYQTVSHLTTKKIENFSTNFDYKLYLDTVKANISDIVRSVNSGRLYLKNDSQDKSNFTPGESYSTTTYPPGDGVPSKIDSEIEHCFKNCLLYDNIVHFTLNLISIGTSMHGQKLNKDTCRSLASCVSALIDFMPLSLYKGLDAITLDYIPDEGYVPIQNGGGATTSSVDSGKRRPFMNEIFIKLHMQRAITPYTLHAISSYLLEPDSSLEDLNVASDFILKTASLGLRNNHTEYSTFLRKDNYYILKLLMSQLRSFPIWSSIPPKGVIDHNWKVESYIPSIAIVTTIIIILMDSCLYTTDHAFRTGAATLTFEEVKKVVEIARHLAFYTYSNPRLACYTSMGGSRLLEVVLIYATTNLLRNVYLRDMRSSYYESDFWKYNADIFTRDFNYNRFEKMGSNVVRSARKVVRVSTVASSVPVEKIYENTIKNSIVLEGMCLDSVFAKMSSSNEYGAADWMRYEEWDQKDRIFSFMKYLPFLIPFEIRWNLFTRAMVIQYKPNTPDVLNFFNHRGDSQRSSESIVVRRKCLFEDGYTQMTGRRFDIRSNVHVTMIDEHNTKEDGVDAGGIFKEFLTDVIKLVVDPSYGLFVCNEFGDYYPQPLSLSIDNEHSYQYKFVGELLGKCLFEGMSANVSLSPIFLANIMERQLSLDDLARFDQNIYRGLCLILRMGKEEIDSCMLNFTIDIPTLDGSSTVQLIEGGEAINVNHENRFSYAILVSEFIMCAQMSAQCSSISSGMSNSIDLQWLLLFNEFELYRAYGCSKSPIDIEDFKNNVNYDGYDMNSPTILLFWDVVESMDQDFLEKLIKFSTGSPRPHILGFSYLEPRFCIKHSRRIRKNGLPESSACFNLLLLPEYDTFYILKEKLEVAIESSNSFYAA